MRSARIPRYQHHKASGQARVTIDGRDHYLGPYDSPESRERYRQLIDRWQLRRRARTCPTMSVGELVLLYTDFARGYYLKNGKPTSEPGLIKVAVRPLVRLYSRTQLIDFGPRDLKQVREELVKCGMARTTVNGLTLRIVRMFRWAVSEEYCPAEVLVALETVPGLRKGRTTARESEPVAPAPEADVNAALPFLPAAVRDMVRIQLLTGCRPGEVVAFRPCDVNREGDVWVFVPASHKTEHHGRGRRVYVGPRAQAILGPYLDNRPAQKFCFSPAEADQARRADRHAARVTPMSCGNRPGSNRRGNPKLRPGEQYTVQSYRQAIDRGCDAAKVARWTPNRLRHSRGTDLRRRTAWSRPGPCSATRRWRRPRCTPSRTTPAPPRSCRKSVEGDSPRFFARLDSGSRFCRKEWRRKWPPGHEPMPRLCFA